MYVHARDRMMFGITTKATPIVIDLGLGVKDRLSCNHCKIKALKCKTLGTEVTHAHNIVLCAFYADDHLPTYISLLTPVGNGHQSYTW